MKQWLISGLLITMLFAAGAIGCCNQTSKLCCESAELGGFGETLRSYCNDYVVTAARYLRKFDSEAERREQKVLLERFVAGLQSCTTIACVEKAVDTSTLVPKFNVVFDTDHPDAQTRPIGSEAERVRLLLCGLDHGLNVKLE